MGAWGTTVWPESWRESGEDSPDAFYPGIREGEEVAWESGLDGLVELARPRCDVLVYQSEGGVVEERKGPNVSSLVSSTLPLSLNLQNPLSRAKPSS